MIKKSGIYKITNKKNGRAYVGSSTNLDAREKKHFSLLKKGTHHCRHMQNSFNKNGEEYFLFEIIEFCDDDSDFLKIRETYWIGTLNTANRKYGYNIRPEGHMTRHSEETKRLISENQKGRLLTAGWKKSISKSHLGKKKTREHAKNISLSQSFFTGEKLQELLKLRKSGLSCPDIAKYFGCDRRTVSRTLSAKQTGHKDIIDPLSKESRPNGRYVPSYNETQKDQICLLIKAGFKQKDIAKAHNIKRNAVYKIRNKYIPDAAFGQREWGY